MLNRTARLLLLCLSASFVSAPFLPAQSLPNQWMWASGASTVPIVPGSNSGNPGVYGTLGVPAGGNVPGGRQGAVTWTDSSGNLWLFGGSGYDANGTFAFLNDLWEYQVSLGQWAWMGGASAVPVGSPESGGNPGIYGSLGIPSTANIPGSRTGAVGWMDKNGNLWLFGGAGIDSTGLSGNLNDLWEYIPSTGAWAWMGGSSTIGSAGAVPGIYGTLGQPSPVNVPGSRNFAVSWNDNTGNFWLFGGYGSDSANNFGVLNDLWKYSPSTAQWTWVSGSSGLPGGIGASGSYGTLGTPAATNVPGAREAAIAWTDAGGNFWLFGGFGFMPASQGFLNDLWKFDPATSQWTWVSGSDTLPFGDNGNPGVYGTLDVPAAGNEPGSRTSAVAWTDRNGKLWLFGGEGDDATGSAINFLNDLWAFDPATVQWTWMGGSSRFSESCIQQGVCGQAGIYGTLGVPSPQNFPGSRQSAVAWTDLNHNLWLFAGSGQDSVGTLGLLNDLWEYAQPSVPAAPPAPSLAQGNYTAAQTVTLTDSMPNATIYFTTNGTIPDTGSTIYVDPIAVTSSETINAIAVVPGYADSVIAAATYTITLPPAATPVLSLAAGTYTSAQTVTISDATPGATVYYSTDGTMPAPNSPQYTAPIAVSSSETVKAIAVAAGYATSSAAAATYTINAPPLDFSLAASPSSMSVVAGQSASTTITITPLNSFNAAVSFTCSGLPSGAACSFSPATVTPSGAPASTTLAITVPAATAMLDPHPGSSWPGPVLALGFGLCFVRRRNTRLALRRLLPLALAAVLLTVGCGGASHAIPSPPLHQATTSTITVTATAGTLQHTATFTLTVN